jgi:inner membrane protein
MDLLTQGLAGSILAVSIAKPEETRKASLIGLLSGLSADLDFFIQSSNDPLLNLEYHRHFTHSIFFIPVAALLLSIIFWPFFKKTMSWIRIFIFSLAGYLLSGFIDACTSYGTRLLWPLSDERISFNIISIIDPIFTLALLIGLVTAFTMKQKFPAHFALFLATGYLLLGLLQHYRIEQISYDYAQKQGHEVERLLVKPTLGNNWLWRSVYQYQGYYYVNAFRVNPFTGDKVTYPGSRIALFSAAENSLRLPENSILLNDIDRFAYFSNQYLALHPEQPDIVIDVRYSNLPNSTLPLWGIKLNGQQPEQHAIYEIYRDKSSQTRKTFISMLFNQDASAKENI